MFAARNMMIAGGFNPLSLSPALWLSDTGADASVWPDLSGNGRNATQSNADYRPSIQGNALNGRQVRRFDGANDIMIGPKILTASNFSCFVVLMAAPQQNKNILAQRTESAAIGRTQFIATEDSASPYNTHRLFFNNGTSYSVRATTLGLSATVAKLLYSQSDGSGNSHVRVNGGSAEGALTGASWTPHDSGYLLGAISNALNQFAGDIAEILVFPTALSDANRQTVESYLNAKWAIY